MRIFNTMRSFAHIIAEVWKDCFLMAAGFMVSHATDIILLLTVLLLVGAYLVGLPPLLLLLIVAAMFVAWVVDIRASKRHIFQMDRRRKR